MSLGRPNEPDRYLQRVALAGAIAVGAIVVASLLGPSEETVKDWLLDRHIGVEGPTVILPELDIVPDDQPRQQDPLEHMSSATEGVELSEERPTPVEDSPTLVAPSKTDIGRQGPSRRNLPDDAIVAPDPNPERSEEQHTRSQTSEDFVLEHMVRPIYPEHAGLTTRNRTVTVSVDIWVDPTGRITDALIAKSDGGRAFADAVLAAIRQWRFRPLRANAAWMSSRVTFRFDLERDTIHIETPLFRTD